MTTQARELAKIVTNAGDLSFSDDITKQLNLIHEEKKNA